MPRLAAQSAMMIVTIKEMVESGERILIVNDSIICKIGSGKKLLILSIASGVISIFRPIKETKTLLTLTKEQKPIINNKQLRLPYHRFCDN